MNKDEFFLKRIRELANLAYQRDIVTFSDFLDLNEWNILNSQSFRQLGVTVESYGGYEYAERQMAAFHPDALAFTWEYPISCLKIQPISQKYSDALGHRDYLGALLNLGINRNVLGDILIEDNTAWVFCQNRISDFIMENFTRVRHTNVSVSAVTSPSELPSPHFVPISGTCSSVRLDTLISLAFGASRSSMVPCIEGGLVFVNGRLITSNGYEPKPGDIISVRKKGRFIFDGVSHQTKKGRLSVKLRRYA